MSDRIGIELPGPDDEIFVVVKFLGKGFFGQVYRAIGKESKTEVAVKMLPADELDSPSTIRVRSFLNEQMGALLQIRHPNVVSYLYIDEGTMAEIGPYIMLEYVTGGTLLQFLEKARKSNEQLTLPTALKLMSQISLGAQAINEQLVHRDIKPDNILLLGEEDPIVKICDFGIAKAALEGTRLETFKGIQHFRYMAPEVIQRGKNTTKIDVYSVGLVFYEILTLEHPLVSQVSDPDDPFEWHDVHQHKQCQDVRSVRSDVPRHISKLLLRMTDKSPNVRPNWEEVLSALTSEPRSSPTKLPNIDPSIVTIMEQTAEAKFREEQAEKVRILDEQKRTKDTAIRNATLRAEVDARQNDLLAEFDEKITYLNSQVPDYQFTIEVGENFRKYILPTHNAIVVSLQQPNWIEAIFGEHESIRAVGVMCIEGALSFNLVLRSPADNVFQGSWAAIGATVNAFMGSDVRKKAYEEAGVDAATIDYMETFEENVPWRRDGPKNFGLRNLQNFVKHFNSNAMGLFSFRQLDLHESFAELVKMVVKIP